MPQLREAYRSLRSAPLITGLALLSLAIGIGAGISVFSVFNAALLKPLPVSRPNSLALVTSGDDLNGYFPFAVWNQIRDRNLLPLSFAWSYETLNMAPRGPVDAVGGVWATGTMFDVLGLRPSVGRVLTAEDDRPGGGRDGPVAVLSHLFWERRFGSSREVLGTSIFLDGAAFTIIGVLPEEFQGLDVGLPFDVVVPIHTAPLTTSSLKSLSGYQTYVQIMLRLAPGQQPESGSALLRSAQTEIRAATMPDYVSGADRDGYLRDPLTVTRAPSGHSALQYRYQRPLVIMLAVVGLILLITCANLAGLLRARAQSRRRELAVRVALGASRANLVGQLMLESVMLSTVGVTAALILNEIAAPFLAAQLSSPSYGVVLNLFPDWRIVTLTVVIGTVTTLLFGTWPAIAASRVQPIDALTERHTFGRDAALARDVLLVAQLTVSFGLIFCAGLFSRSLSVLAHVETGFDGARVLVVGVTGQGSKDPGRAAERYNSAVIAASRLPGVASSAASITLPAGDLRMMPRIAAAGSGDAPLYDRAVRGNIVTPGWFETLGLRLLAGRDFDRGDNQDSIPVVVIDETLARRLFSSSDPIDEIVSDIGFGKTPRPVRVVGVVSTAIYDSIRVAPPPTIYFPVAQSRDQPVMRSPRFFVSVRTISDRPSALVRSVADAIGRAEPNASLTFRTLSEQVEASFTAERLVAALSALFALVALMLAGVGSYGMTACEVERRRSEIALRLALGASSASIMRMTLKRVSELSSAAAVAGIVISLIAGRLIATFLFRIELRDPYSAAGAVGVLVSTCLAAALVPARRIARIEVMPFLK